MKEMPILFSGEMVRAILEGRKIMTRRVIKLGEITANQVEKIKHVSGNEWRVCFPTTEHIIKCPWGQVGDGLWVRETWGAVSKNDDPAPLDECKIEYRADLSAGCTDYPGGWPAEDARGYDDAPKWRPSIHMPRWTSRITLEITVVRVERVQDIPNDDTVKEGIVPPIPAHINNGWCTTQFAKLWDSSYAKRGFGWSINPYVWVIKFKRVQKEVLS